MELVNKICSMCRRDIDPLALVCPYCQNSVDYQYLLDIPITKITQERKPVRQEISNIIAIIIGCCLAFVGFLLFGFWIAVGIMIICVPGVKIIISSAIKAEGFDEAVINCPGCYHEELYRWKENTFKNDKKGRFICSNCKKTTCLAVT